MLNEVDGRHFLYRRTGEHYLDACVERKDAYGSGSIMIWAVITPRHKTDVVFIDCRLMGVRCRDEILRCHVVPFIRHNGGVFQQNNTRLHIACVCTEFLQHHNINGLPWPVFSADMLPIEHLWDILGGRVRQRHQQPQTLNHLQQALAIE